MIQFYITETFRVPLPLLRMGEKKVTLKYN